jgi:hypothetical protein
MVRTLTACALLMLSAGMLAAYDPPARPGPTETVVQLAVQPMAAPRPALKYQLLPELREMNPGNPIQAYLKCFMEQNNFYFNKESEEKREKYQTMPLAELPVKELQGYGSASLRQADWAARLDAPDWQILLQAKRDGVYLLLPDVQQLRRLASALKVRFRVEIAEKRFADAVRTAKTMLALARHLGEHPTLIGNLVGIAIAQMAIGPLEEMIAQPGCPNLYGALTHLPDPFIDLRQGMRGETLFIYTELEGLDDKEPMSEADVKKVMSRVRELFKGIAGVPKEDVDSLVRKRAADEEYLQAARRRIVEADYPAERVKRFTPAQVVLLDEKLTYEDVRDRLSQWMGMPYWEIESRKLFEQAKNREGGLFIGLVAAYGKVKAAQARLQQRFAMLRHVEAIRLHAAETGKLPARLDEIKVPLPVDPMTGKPFAYGVEGGKASLRGTPPRGQENVAAFNIRYEITLRQ